MRRGPGSADILMALIYNLIRTPTEAAAKAHPDVEVSLPSFCDTLDDGPEQRLADDGDVVERRLEALQRVENVAEGVGAALD